MTWHHFPGTPNGNVLRFLPVSSPSLLPSCHFNLYYSVRVSPTTVLFHNLSRWRLHHFLVILSFFSGSDFRGTTIHWSHFFKSVQLCDKVAMHWDHGWGCFLNIWWGRARHHSWHSMCRYGSRGWKYKKSVRQTQSLKLLVVISAMEKITIEEWEEEQLTD